VDTGAYITILYKGTLENVFQNAGIQLPTMHYSNEAEIHDFTGKKAKVPELVAKSATRLSMC